MSEDAVIFPNGRLGHQSFKSPSGFSGKPGCPVSSGLHILAELPMTMVSGEEQVARDLFKNQEHCM